MPLPSHVVENDQKSSCHYRSQYQYKYLSSHHDGIISVLSHLLFCQLCSCQILPCLSSTMRYLQNALNNENNFLTLNIIVTPSLSLSFISSVLTGDYKETSDMLPVQCDGPSSFFHNITKSVFLLVCDYNEVLRDFDYYKQTGW